MLVHRTEGESAGPEYAVNEEGLEDPCGKVNIYISGASGTSHIVPRIEYGFVYALCRHNLPVCVTSLLLVVVLPACHYLIKNINPSHGQPVHKIAVPFGGSLCPC